MLRSQLLPPPCLAAHRSSPFVFLLLLLLPLLPADSFAQRSAAALDDSDFPDVITQAISARELPIAKALVDAAFFHTGEQASYFFQGDRYYRLTGTKVDAGYPKSLPGEWNGLPSEFSAGIDAAVQDPYRGVIYFFKGNQYIGINAEKTVFWGPVSLPGGWRGLPSDFASDLDAAIDHDGSVVFIKGDRHATMTNEQFVGVSDRPASALTGVGKVDAAFKYSNDRNYFFSDDMFSRAIGFEKEPRQLNPITSSWIGVKPATNSSPIDPNATKVAYVAYGWNQGVTNGFFAQVGDRAWMHRDNEARRNSECQEVSKTSNTISLSCGDNADQFKIQLEGSNAAVFKVIRRDTGTSQDAIGRITKTEIADVVADEDLQDPFRPGDIQKIMQWISQNTSNSRISYCYKNSMGRGAGTPLTTCPAGTERDGALCYPTCRSGFAGSVTECRGVCPQEFTDIGLFCQKPAAYTRDGFGWQVGDPLLPNYSGPIGRCEAKHGKGNCEQKGAVIYAKCRAGFQQGAVVTQCARPCPDGWTDTGTGCTKPSYTRGVGQAMTCAAGLQEDTGLCYQNCPTGYTGVGPVCWQQCKGDQRWDCGVGCAADQNACASSTADMVLAPINLIIGLVDMGISARAKAAIDAAAKAGMAGTSAAANGLTELALDGTPKWAQLLDELQELDALAGTELATNLTGVGLDLSNVGQGLQDEIEKWTAEYEYSFAANTTSSVESAINSRFDYNTRRYIKRYYALHHLGSLLEADGWRIAKLVMTAGGIVTGILGDPGFVATINAYSHPTCGPVGGIPFPRVQKVDPGTLISPSGTTWEQISRQRSASLDQVPLVQVSVGSDGTAWGLDTDGNIFHRMQGRWNNIPGQLTQISVGSVTDVWGVNRSNEIYRWTGSSWFRMPGTMNQVSVGSDGAVWGLDANGNIFRWVVPKNWYAYSGMTGSQRFITGSREQIPGTLHHISVGNANDVWGVNASNMVYRWSNQSKSWTRIPGSLKQVSVGGDGAVWGVAPDGQIFRWTGETWERIPGGLDQISVADWGLVWGVNQSSQVFERRF